MLKALEDSIFPFSFDILWINPLCGFAELSLDPCDFFQCSAGGHGGVSSIWNVFSSECLNLVVDMSAAAKAAGYLVSTSLGSGNVFHFLGRFKCQRWNDVECK